MKTVEQLVADWQAGELSQEELNQLKQALANPAARAELVAEWLLDEAIHDALRSHTSSATDRAASGVRAPVPPARASSVPGRRTGRRFSWLVWREKRVTLGWSAAVVAGLCVFLLGTVFYFRNAAVGRLGQTPIPLVLERDGRSLTPAPGQPIYPDDNLRLPLESAGPVTLILGAGKAQFELAPGAEVRVGNPLFGQRLVLRTGAVEASVSPQPPLRPLVVSTPNARVKVVGTRFSLAVTGAVTRLAVTEGTVQLRKLVMGALDAVPQVTVRGGEMAEASPDAKLVVLPVTGFLATDRWLVPQTVAFSEADSKGTPLTAAGSASLPPGMRAVERLRGYLVAPRTGEYRFYLASLRRDAAAELWLSPDDRPASKARLATVVASEQPGAAAPAGGARYQGFGAALEADWRRSPSQQSAPCRLVAGRRYYLEILHEGSGLDSLAVGWVLPGQTDPARPTMIDIDALSPFVSGTSENPNR